MCDTRPSSIGIDFASSSRKASPGISITSPAININQIDGFSSPRDSAHTPPGILTKIETRMYKNSNLSTMTSTKCLCTNCLKEKENSLCKSCTTIHLKFYSRKEALSLAQQKKMKLSEEIDAIAREPCSIAAECNSASENIVRLQKEIAEKRKKIEERKKENRRLERQTHRSIEVMKSLEPYFGKLKQAEDYKRDREARKRTQLQNMQNELSKRRQELALILSGIFPVSEVIIEAAPPSKPSSKWALVSGTVPITGHIFQIREMACPDEKTLIELGLGLSQSPLNLSTELRPAFASLLLTVQLVNLLAYIMDCRLPYLIPVKELALRDKWTKVLLDEEWLKLCQCILVLGLRMGMNHESLHFNCPHSNLIEMGRHILDGKIVENLQPLGVDGNYYENITGSGRITEKDLPDWDIIDGEEM